MVKHTEIAVETLAEVEGGIPWTNAEKTLLDNCHRLSEFVEIGKKLPEKGDKDKQIRASLIRFLLMGGNEKHRPAPMGICVKGAEITGELNLEACTSELGLYLRGCLFSAPLNLADAKLSYLNLTGSSLQGANLQQLNLTKNLFLIEVKNTGEINLVGAKIDGQFSCNGATFNNDKGYALNCNGAAIGKGVFLDKGFTATREVNFGSAKIGGQFSCIGAKFDSPDGYALDCNAATIGASVSLDGSSTTTREVNFSGAKIGGQFVCTGAKFKNTEGSSLNCNGAVIDHDVFLNEKFTATKKIDFVSAEIGGPFFLDNCSITDIIDFTHCHFQGEALFNRAEINDALNLNSAQIDRALDLRNFKTAPQVVDLRNARIHTLKDDESIWKQTKVNLLNGFSYAVLDSILPVDARLKWLEKNKLPYTDNFNPQPTDARLEWLKKNKEDSKYNFNPQPYLQLAKALRERGKRAAATRIMIEREKRQIKAECLEAWHVLDWTWWHILACVKHTSLRYFLLPIFRLTFGYGHAPLRGLVTAITLMVAAIILYGKIDSNGNMVPNHTVILTSPEWREAVKEYESCEKAHCPYPVQIWRENPVVKDYETFSAIGYGIDIVLPLVPIGQETAWSPSLERGLLAKIGFYARWVFQIMGWILAAMAAGALTGIIGRRD